MADAGADGAQVELVRRHYAAYDRRDIDGIVETLHPQVEIVSHDELGKADRAWRGRAAARGLFVEITALVADTRVEILSLEAERDRVEATVRLHGVLRATGQTGPVPAVHRFELRDGLIAKIETFRPDWRG
jgi:ketosteroid isomerase-like protein